MEQISWLLLELYRSATEIPLTDFQDYVLNLLQTVIPFSTATWACGRVLPTGVIHHSVHQFGDPPDRLMDYEEVKHQDVAAFAAWQNLGRAMVFHAPSLYHDQVYSGIREYAKRWKHQNFILASRPIERSGLLQWIGVYRADADNQYGERERQLMELCLPHFIEALRINRLMHLGSCTTSKSDASAIVDQFGAFQHSDARFMELLQHEWPSCTGEQLSEQIMAIMNRRSRNQYVGRAVVICIRRIRDLALLNIREKTPIDMLTPRQLEVARHIAKGLDYKRIAQHLGLSPTTVRNYTQAIHERLNVRTNAELCTQLSALPPCHAEA